MKKLEIDIRKYNMMNGIHPSMWQDICKYELVKAGFDMNKPISQYFDRLTLMAKFTQDGEAIHNENPNGLPKDLSQIRMKFLIAADEIQETKPKYMVVAVKLPTGAIELITNTDQIQSKVEYYKNAYDDNFCLKTNQAIQIVGFMLV